MVEVKSFGTSWTQRDVPPLWSARVAFGAGGEIEVPLPAHFVPGDDPSTQQESALRGMESLAEALLRYVEEHRRSLSSE